MNGQLVGKGLNDRQRWHERFFAAVQDYRLTRTLGMTAVGCRRCFDSSMLDVRNDASMSEAARRSAGFVLPGA
jgi:hypothetical protein